MTARSMDAAPARAATARTARPNGWWGIVVFVATEATLFGVIVGSYFYLRFRAVHWPPEGIAPPSITVPLVLAGVLVATSIPVQLSFSFARRERLRAAWWLLALAAFVQAGYLAMQIQLFVDDVHKFGPEHTAYGSIYFTMLGAHHAHVFVGILLETWLLMRLLGGVTRYRLVGLQSTAFYWHFINVIALVVVGAQLSANV
jgi:heme/copper-type cytochrome/quinol oxidase subunit 3